MQIEKGMLRRVDELGRVVIPKELRGALKIECGNLLEFGLSNDGTMHLQKFHKMNEIEDFANRCMRACEIIRGVEFFVTDTDNVVAVGNLPQNMYKNSPVSEKIRGYIRDKKLIKIDADGLGEIVVGYTPNGKDKNFLLFPVLSSGDIMGSVIMLCDKQIMDKVNLVGAVIAQFLADYMEE